MERNEFNFLQPALPDKTADITRTSCWNIFDNGFQKEGMIQTFHIEKTVPDDWAFQNVKKARPTVSWATGKQLI
jgi:hypothetical protein